MTEEALVNLNPRASLTTLGIRTISADRVEAAAAQSCRHLPIVSYHTTPERLSPRDFSINIAPNSISISHRKWAII